MKKTRAGAPKFGQTKKGFQTTRDRKERLKGLIVRAKRGRKAGDGVPLESFARSRSNQPSPERSGKRTNEGVTGRFESKRREMSEIELARVHQQQRRHPARGEGNNKRPGAQRRREKHQKEEQEDFGQTWRIRTAPVHRRFEARIHHHPEQKRRGVGSRGDRKPSNCVRIGRFWARYRYRGGFKRGGKAFLWLI